MMAPPGVAALRSGRNKGNVSYANDEEGFGGAALSNTTLASEDEEEEDEFDNDEEDEDDEDEDEEEEEDSESEGEEDEAEEEDSESEGEEDGDDEEEDSESENKRAKKKQRFAAPNGENNKKRKRAENFGRNGIDNKVLADAKKKADEFNFKVGSGAYVALVVLLAGGAVGITSMNPAKIEKFASQLRLGGETKKGEKKKMAHSTIWNAMERDKTNFLRNEDRTYSLAKDLKKKETMTKKEIESAVEKINDEVLADAKKEASKFNFKVGSGAYVALVVLLAGGAVGIPSMNPTTIEEFASQLSLEGKTKKGEKKKMDHSTIWAAMERDKTNFLRNEDRTYSLAKDLKKKKKETMTKKEIESAVEKINDEVLADAKKEASEFNFKVGSGAYVALVVLLAGGAIGIPSMNPAKIEKFASQLSLEGKTKNGKKTKMDYYTIRNAMEADKTNFLRNEDGGTYSLARELKKKKETKKKEKEERKSEPRVVHVKRGEWDSTKFEDVLFYGNKDKWCPLCDGRTVVNRTFVMFYSHWILEDMAEEVVIEHYGNEIKIKTERIKKALDYYFEKKLETSPRSDIKSFDDVCRQHEELCHHCWTKLEKWLKQP